MLDSKCEGPDPRKIADQVVNSTDIRWFTAAYMRFLRFGDGESEFKREIASRFLKSWMRLLSELCEHGLSALVFFGICKTSEEQISNAQPAARAFIESIRSACTLAEFSLASKTFSESSRGIRNQFNENDLYLIGRELHLKAAQLMIDAHREICDGRDVGLASVEIQQFRIREEKRK